MLAGDRKEGETGADRRERKIRLDGGTGACSRVNRIVNGKSWGDPGLSLSRSLSLHRDHVTRLRSSYLGSEKRSFLAIHPLLLLLDILRSSRVPLTIRSSFSCHIRRRFRRRKKERKKEAGAETNLREILLSTTFIGSSARTLTGCCSYSILHRGLQVIWSERWVTWRIPVLQETFHSQKKKREKKKREKTLYGRLQND